MAWRVNRQNGVKFNRSRSSRSSSRLPHERPAEIKGIAWAHLNMSCRK